MYCSKVLRICARQICLLVQIKSIIQNDLWYGFIHPERCAGKSSSIIRFRRNFQLIYFHFGIAHTNTDSDHIWWQFKFILENMFRPLVMTMLNKMLISHGCLACIKLMNRLFVFACKIHVYKIWSWNPVQMTNSCLDWHLKRISKSFFSCFIPFVAHYFMKKKSAVDLLEHELRLVQDSAKYVNTGTYWYDSSSWQQCIACKYIYMYTNRSMFQMIITMQKTDGSEKSLSVLWKQSDFDIQIAYFACWAHRLCSTETGVRLFCVWWTVYNI